MTNVGNGKALEDKSVQNNSNFMNETATDAKISKQFSYYKILLTNVIP